MNIHKTLSLKFLSFKLHFQCKKMSIFTHQNLRYETVFYFFADGFFFVIVSCRANDYL